MTPKEIDKYHRGICKEEARCRLYGLLRRMQISSVEPDKRKRAKFLKWADQEGYTKEGNWSEAKDKVKELEYLNLTGKAWEECVPEIVFLEREWDARHQRDDRFRIPLIPVLLDPFDLNPGRVKYFMNAAQYFDWKIVLDGVFTSRVLLDKLEEGHVGAEFAAGDPNLPDCLGEAYQEFIQNRKGFTSDHYWAVGSKELSEHVRNVLRKEDHDLLLGQNLAWGLQKLGLLPNTQDLQEDSIVESRKSVPFIGGWARTFTVGEDPTKWGQNVERKILDGMKEVADRMQALADLVELNKKVVDAGGWDKAARKISELVYEAMDRKEHEKEEAQ